MTKKSKTCLVKICFSVITPDEVKGNFATLNEAVLANNWPRLAEARGKVLFVMINSGNERSDYLEGHPSLTGRVMFVFSEAGNPETAFIKIDDPVANFAEIGNRVGEGYMVRTRSDANTQEARSNDTARRESAFSSCAQIISTDYYRPDGRDGWSDFSVEVPGGKLARLSPCSDAGDLMSCDINE